MDERTFKAIKREEIQARDRANYQAHRDRDCAYMRAWRATHLEEERARSLVRNRARRVAHREELNARARAYKAAHRDEINARERARRAVKREAEREEREARLAEQATERAQRRAVKREAEREEREARLAEQVAERAQRQAEIEAELDRKRAARVAEREKREAERVAWRAAHPEEVRALNRETQKQWRARNPAAHLAVSARWLRAHRDQHNRASCERAQKLRLTACVFCHREKLVRADQAGWTTNIVVKGLTIRINTCSSECRDKMRIDYQQQIESGGRRCRCGARQTKQDRAWFEVVHISSRWLPEENLFLAGRYYLAPTCSEKCLQQAQTTLAEEIKWLRLAKEKHQQAVHLFRRLSPRAI